MRWADAPATFTIAAATVVASLLLIFMGAVPQAALAGGFVPARLGMAAASVPLVPVALTPLTATLIHGGLAHLLFNMVMLVFVGRLVERPLGAAAMAVLYLAGAYASVAGQWLAGPGSTVPMIGASGAVSALVGAYALLFGERRAKAIGPVPAEVVHVAWLAVAWIGVQLLIGATGGDQQVAIAAHIGGFLAGLACARPLLLWRWRGA